MTLSAALQSFFVTVLEFRKTSGNALMSFLQDATKPVGKRAECRNAGVLSMG